jgi:hypothetical protein
VAGVAFELGRKGEDVGIAKIIGNGFDAEDRVRQQALGAFDAGADAVGARSDTKGVGEALAEGGVTETEFVRDGFERAATVAAALEGAAGRAGEAVFAAGLVAFGAA